MRAARERAPRKRNWGGHRPGAGRKPKGEFAQVTHGPRPPLRPGGPVLITLEFARGLPDLSRGRPARTLEEALREADGRFGLALLAHSLHPDHLHLILRARSRAALSRAMTGLCVRTARALNGLLGRSGTVYADRYEVRVLKSPRDVRAATRAPCAWRSAPDEIGRHRKPCSPKRAPKADEDAASGA